MIDWRCGVEIELMAPSGRSRRDLAERLAADCGGEVETFWHVQSEPSLVPGTPSFDNLTQGFAVHDAEGEPIARLVDDLTLTHDLDRSRPSRPGWLRVLSDDRRLLHLAQRIVPPEGPLERMLQPLADLFGTDVVVEGPIHKVVDRIGSPIALATGLPGERERPCELVTPPMDDAVETRLEALLGPARSLGFSVPREAAVHVHFENLPFRDARAVAALVERWMADGPAIKEAVRTNPHCVRLGPWSEAVLEVVRAPDFVDLDWPTAQDRLATAEPSKYVDLNLRNLVFPRLGLPTIEVRVLPGAILAAPIVAGAQRFADLFREVLSGAGAAAH